MCRSRIRAYRIVIQYFMPLFIMFGCPSLKPGYCQTRTDYQMRSARSLTIFQPGDAVRIQIYQLFGEGENFDLSRDYPINPDGDIIMPLIGQVRVKGLTVYEVMQTIEERLNQYMNNPYVLVRPLIRVTMQGAFNRPGSYRVDPENSLWDLVSLAGGPTANCDLEKMKAERGGKTIIPDLLEAFERGYSLGEIGIESGDQIMAPGRRGFDFNFFIGLFNLLASIILLYLRLRTGSF